MHFIAFLILTMMTLSPVVYGQTDYQSDLVKITKSIKSMERRQNEIMAALESLTDDQQNLSDKIFEKRFRAVQNLHVYYSTEKSKPLFGFIASKKPFYERYFEQRYQQNINAVLQYSITGDITDFVELETKITEINQYEREKKLLDDTLQSAVSYLEKLSPHNANNDKELNLIIRELESQTASLNGFITQLLQIPNQPSFSPKDNEANFILPVAGVIKQDMRGVFIETNGKSLVSAPADGRILFADDYKKLGYIVITDHGNGYISVMRGLSKLLISNGDIVLQGDPIALTKNSPQSTENTKEKSNKAMLYYELRYNGKTVNPIEHLSGH